MRVSQFAILCASVGASLAFTNLFSVASAADNKTIIDVASNAGNFTTLLNALQKAGLTDTLKGKGPYTVFAPDDAAFNKMGSAALKDLMANKQKLSSTLLYHVVKGNWSAKTLAGVDKEQSQQGSYLSIHSSGGKTMIDDAILTKGDIKCSNGVIHEIDAVLMPQSQAE